MKLSPRAIILLALISEHTGDDGTFWVPSSARLGQWCERTREFVDVNGSGDASIIRSLWKKGLAEQVIGKNCTLNAYSSRVTQAGRKFLDDNTQVHRTTTKQQSKPLIKEN